MVVRCSRCMGFKRSTKNTCKKCMRRRGQRGRGFGKFLKKAKDLVKKAVKFDLGKFAISQRLAYAPKLLDMGASKIKNKKVKKLLRSEMTKNLLNKGQAHYIQNSKQTCLQRKLPV